MSRATAGMDEASGWRRCLPASAKLCRNRAWFDPTSLQGNLHTVLTKD
jgi:hypothetical protein